MTDNLKVVGRAEIFNGDGVLRLQARRKTFYPGEEIYGKLELAVSRKVLVRGVWIKFTGKVHSLTKGSKRSVDLLTGEEDHFCGGVHDVKVGLGEEPDRRTEGYVELPEGVYCWPFTFTIPPNSPLSHYDESFEVGYTLIGVVDAPEMPIATSQIFHHILVTCKSPSTRIESDVTPITKTVQEVKSGFFGMLRKPIVFTLSSAMAPKFAFHSIDTLLPLNCLFENVSPSDSIRIKATLYVQTIITSGLRVENGKLVGKGDGKTVCPEEIYQATLWERVYSLKSKRNSLLIEVPICIDTSVRKDWIREWPRPSALSYHYKRIDPTMPEELGHPTFSFQPAESVQSFTSSGPMFRHAFAVKLSVFNAKKEKLLCPPIIVDVEITPPVAKEAPKRPLEALSQPAAVETPTVHPAVKVATPMAVPVPTRVVADVLSRGPAAMIYDRQARNATEVISTPQQFTQLHRVTEVTAIGTPFFSPAMAQVWAFDMEQEHHEHMAAIAESEEILAIAMPSGYTPLLASPRTSISHQIPDTPIITTTDATTNTTAASITVPTTTPSPAAAGRHEGIASVLVSNTLRRTQAVSASANHLSMSSSSPSEQSEHGSLDGVHLVGQRSTVSLNGSIVLSPESGTNSVEPFSASRSFQIADEEEEEILRLGSPTPNDNTRTIGTIGFQSRPPLPTNLAASMRRGSSNTTGLSNSLRPQSAARVALFTSPLTTPRTVHRQSSNSLFSDPENIHPNLAATLDQVRNYSAMKTPLCDLQANNLSRATTPKSVDYMTMESEAGDPRQAFATSITSTPIRYLSESSVHEFSTPTSYEQQQVGSSEQVRVGSAQGSSSRRVSSIMVL